MMPVLRSGQLELLELSNLTMPSLPEIRRAIMARLFAPSAEVKYLAGFFLAAALCRQVG